MLPDSVAIFGKQTEIYWHSLFFMLSIAAALLLFNELRRLQGRKACSGTLLVGMLSIPLGLLMARALFFIFTVEPGSFFSLSDGGYALYGGVLGYFIALFIAAKIDRRLVLTELMDAAAPAGALGIAIGRAAACFSHEELGYIITDPKWHKFPICAYVESEGNWRLCVFTFEVIMAVVALICTLRLFDAIYISRKGLNKGIGKGKVMLLLGVLYSSSQTLLESWRADAMTMRNNAFVRISQVLSAVILAACFVVLFIELSKKRARVDGNQVLLWVVCTGLLALAFVMEFGKNKETMFRNNIFMIFALGAMGVIGSLLVWGCFDRLGMGAKSARAVKANKPQKTVRIKGRNDPEFEDDFDD